MSESAVGVNEACTKQNGTGTVIGTVPGAGVVVWKGAATSTAEVIVPSASDRPTRSLQAVAAATRGLGESSDRTATTPSVAKLTGPRKRLITCISPPASRWVPVRLMELSVAPARSA